MTDFEVGEVILVRVTALDVTAKFKTTVRGLTGTAEVFSPTKDPVNIPVDRGTPDATASFAYVDEVGYIARVDTAGLTPQGTWTMRVRLYDDQNNNYDNVEYYQFDLRL